jgi:signal recognition particle receptor subunit beta
MIGKKKIPFVVAANKSDLPGRLPAGKIKKELELGKEIPVVAISATKKTDVHEVLESLVDYITQYSA